MHRLIILVLLFAAFSNCLAQRPQPCVVPSQWKARRSRVAPETRTVTYSYYYYDFVNLRKRITEEIEQGSARTNYDIYHFYKTKKAYQFNMQTKNCTASVFDEPFMVYGPGSQDIFTSEIAIGVAGLGGQGLILQEWTGNSTRHKFPGRYYGLWTAKGCLPVSYKVFSSLTGFTDEERFFNIDLKVVDYDFELPYQCRQLVV